MSYYESFKNGFNNPLWNIYLRWAYRQCLKDLERLGFKPDFKKKDMACLLCGVAMERTADEFIKFTLAKNLKAKIWIIDLGEEQARAVSLMVHRKYPGMDINIRRVNALDLATVIPAGSLDWIETDGFTQYFDTPSLKKLIGVWELLLKSDGFITLRDFVTTGTLGYLADKFRIWLIKVWLGADAFRHTEGEFAGLLKQFGLQIIEGRTLLPTYKRISMIRTRKLLSP